MSAEIVQLKRHDLNEGDAVRLKSGGPLMLVATADSEIWSEVQCIWVAGDRGKRRLQTRLFRPETLDLVARGEQS